MNDAIPPWVDKQRPVTGESLLQAHLSLQIPAHVKFAELADKHAAELAEKHAPLPEPHIEPMTDVQVFSRHPPSECPGFAGPIAQQNCLGSRNGSRSGSASFRAVCESLPILGK